MLQAMLHGKLSRKEEDLEDLLTSNTFGLMKYLPTEAILLPFLSLAYDPFTQRFLAGWLRDVVDVEHWRFWPALDHPNCQACEPDVDMMFRHKNGSKTRVLVEAKYRSGKSSEATDRQTAPNDQLAREYDNLRFIAEEEGISRFGVIYLTADFSCPKKELEESALEYQKKRGVTPNLYWLSWRALFDILESKSSCEYRIIHDLRELLSRLNLTLFRRLRFYELIPLGWRFERAIKSWEWRAKAPNWQFERKHSSWSWSPIPSLRQWTFSR